MVGGSKEMVRNRDNSGVNVSFTRLHMAHGLDSLVLPVEKVFPTTVCHGSLYPAAHVPLRSVKVHPPSSRFGERRG